MGRHSKKPFNSLWNRSWNEKVDMNIIQEDFLTDLFFDNKTKKLTFIIRRYYRRPKITRYITSNYVKTPVYEEYSEKTKIIKKFNKIINPLRFLNEEILNLDLNKKFILEIIDKIGIIPEWRKKEIELAEISCKIKSLEEKFRDFEQEKRIYDARPINYQDYSSNFWLRFFLGFFVFFLSFLGYVSKNQAKKNKIQNEKNKKWNKEQKSKITEENQQLFQEIMIFNHDLEKKINILAKKFNEIQTKEIQIVAVDLEGWIDLRDASHFSYFNLNNKKGVYIIWNRTKNKYYVGQSKNIGKRMLQHFKNGEVKNIIFAKDWYDNDSFAYKYYFCETKDELDDLEKRYIAEYNSFKNGYNSTSGNL